MFQNVTMRKPLFTIIESGMQKILFAFACDGTVDSFFQHLLFRESQLGQP